MHVVFGSMGHNVCSISHANPVKQSITSTAVARLARCLPRIAYDPGRTPTCNPWLRRPMPDPLGDGATQRAGSYLVHLTSCPNLLISGIWPSQQVALSWSNSFARSILARLIPWLDSPSDLVLLLIQ